MMQRSGRRKIPFYCSRGCRVLSLGYLPVENNSYEQRNLPAVRCSNSTLQSSRCIHLCVFAVQEAYKQRLRVPTDIVVERKIGYATPLLWATLGRR